VRHDCYDPAPAAADCCLPARQVLARLPLLQQLSVKGAPLAAGATHQQELLVGGPRSATLSALAVKAEWVCRSADPMLLARC
jgi:hypothetical protein